MVHLDFPITNNEAKYEALVEGLDLAKAMGATNVIVYCDSQVVTSQVNSDFECKGEKMKRYLEQLDLVDEVKATTEQRLARYQNLMAKHYNSRVKHRDFQVRDLVLRKVMGATRDPSQGKLGPNWEGPYRIASWQRKGTYHLETLDRKKLHNLWNTKHLKKYYQYTMA
ncbi:uncharacterized protein LOC115969823 [Quercus lobata]|uniref:uncharacterized protein LOC115969823 n=1 Tax=Quercus lobata TaxID=97700 RepID=UPI0012474235|nr:uncharacterized protein LOC115969823 [Quercus lobata]